MSARMLTPEKLQQAVDLFVIHGNKTAAARAINIPTTTYNFRYAEAVARGYTPSPDALTKDRVSSSDLRAQIESLKEQLTSRPRQVEVELPPVIIKPHYTVRTDRGNGEKIRICAIGDAHDSPKIPNKERFEWIGAHIKATKPDVVVQIGDFLTLDSLNNYEPNETFAGKLKPTFQADVSSFIEALGAMDVNGPELHCTLGNHEQRLFSYENSHPEVYGMMQLELQGAFERFGWTFSPYKFIQKYGGVGFTHSATNSMGRAYGGKISENSIANDSLFDLVIGHSHRRRLVRVPKIGDDNNLAVLNLGCALPDGFIETYARHSSTGWSFGIYDLTIQHGGLQSESFIPMSELGSLYGGGRRSNRKDFSEPPKNNLMDN